MLKRRSFLGLASGVAAMALPGCAALTQEVPRFAWGQEVEFESMRFQFHSARTTGSYTNFVNQLIVAGDNVFVIIDITTINMTGRPLESHFRPFFRLRDAAGAIYESDLTHTIGINMGKPGRPSAGQSMNPNTRIREEIVFAVPRRPYVLAVAVPSIARAGFGGNVTRSGRYFLYDIASQLQN